MQMKVVPGDHGYRQTQGKRGSWPADLSNAFSCCLSKFYVMEYKASPLRNVAAFGVHAFLSGTEIAAH